MTDPKYIEFNVFFARGESVRVSAIDPDGARSIALSTAKRRGTVITKVKVAKGSNRPGPRPAIDPTDLFGGSARVRS